MEGRKESARERVERQQCSVGKRGRDSFIFGVLPQAVSQRTERDSV